MTSDSCTCCAWMQGVQLILIPLQKALCCVVRSHYDGHMQSYISYTKDYRIFDSYSCSHLPRSHSCSISTCDLPSVNIKGSCSDPWTENFLFSVILSDSNIHRAFHPSIWHKGFRGFSGCYYKCCYCCWWYFERNVNIHRTHINCRYWRVIQTRKNLKRQ